MADVSATLRAWSATAASNNPTGTTSIGTGLDDNLRQIQATVRQFFATKGTNMASAATVDLSTADGSFVDITGTTTITALGTEGAGIGYWVRFTGALTLTHNATTLILPGAANITTTNGDVAYFVSLGSGNWLCMSYMVCGTVPFGVEGSFTAACTGPFASSNATVRYSRMGKQVQLTLNSVRPSGNSTAAPITIDLTSMPASIRPVTAQTVPSGIVTDNGSDQAIPGAVAISTSGNATLTLTGATTNFSSTAGTVGFYGFSIAYLSA